MLHLGNAWDVEALKGSNMSNKSLVAFDTDRIKEYIFATAKLREISGASMLLDALNLEVMPRLAQDYRAEKIYTGGGSGLFVVDTDRANDLITAVQRAYQEKTAGAATITGVWVELPPDFDRQNTPIRDIWRLIGLELAARKTQLPSAWPLVTHPLLKTCDSDAVYYARTHEPEGSYLSAPSKRKRDRYDAEDEQAKANQGPRDFDAIGNVSSPSGYFALVYLDGDGFGHVLEACQTLDEIGRVSHAIHRGLKDAREAAIKKSSVPRQHYEAFIAGGDDLLLALPAQHALPVTLDLIQRFDQRMDQEHLPAKLTLSASIVWSHVTYPFDVWLELTDDALKFAKRQGARWKQKGLINFLVVSEANHLSFTDYYQDVLRYDTPAQWPVYRTVRPYTPDALCQLMDRRHSFPTLSRSRLEAIRRAVFQPSLFQSELEAIQVLTHWRKHDERVAFHNLVRDFVPPGETAQQPCFPYVKAQTSADQIAYYTPLADLAELWDFLPGGDDANRYA
jgi:hypothetical protein